MSKPVKIIGGLAAAVVVVFVVLLVLAKVLITPERVKQTVLPMAEEALARKLSLGDVSVSLFSGIELRDIKVYEANGQDLFVTTDLVRLKYQLLPLLAMKVVVDEVRIEQPDITVIRYADDRFNFSDLTGSERSPVDKSERDTGSSKSDAPPINLLVSEVSLVGGRLGFTDHVVNPKTPFRTELKQLDVNAKGITLDGPVPVAVSSQLNGALFSAEGTVQLTGPTADLALKLDGFDVMAFQPYIRDAVPGQLAGLQVAFDLKVQGGIPRLSSEGNVRLSSLGVTLDALPDAPIENASLTLDYQVDLDLEKGHLSLPQARVDYNGLVVKARGEVGQLFNEPVVDLAVQVPDLELGRALAAVPAALVKDVKPLNPSGAVSLEAVLKGKSDDPLKMLHSASVSLNQVAVSTAGYQPSLNGRLSLAGDRLRSEALTLNLAGNSASIDFSAEHLFGKVPAVKADLTSERFDLDPLLQGSGAAATGGQSITDSSNSDTASEELGPFDIPLQADGVIRIGQTLYKGLSVSNFVAQYRLRNNILSINRMEGQVAGGSFSNSATVDLGKKGLVYDGTVGIKTVQADPLLTAFVPKVSGSVLGAMDLNLSISGRGTQWETLSRRLSGKGNMLLADGKVVSPQMLQGLVNILQIDQLNEIVFKNFDGAFTIRDGKVQVNSKILGSNLKLFPKGTFGLDGTLDLAMDTRLSPDLSARIDQGGKVTRYLTDPDGWSQVPLLLSGTFAAPRFGVDPKGVAQQATRTLQNELQRSLQEKLFGKPDQQSETGQPQESPQEDPGQKLLKDSFKRLFGN